MSVFLIFFFVDKRGYRFLECRFVYFFRGDVSFWLIAILIFKGLVWKRRVGSFFFFLGVARFFVLLRRFGEVREVRIFFLVEWFLFLSVLCEEVWRRFRVVGRGIYFAVNIFRAFLRI